MKNAFLLKTIYFLGKNNFDLIRQGCHINAIHRSTKNRVYLNLSASNKSYMSLGCSNVYEQDEHEKKSNKWLKVKLSSSFEIKQKPLNQILKSCFYAWNLLKIKK
jgi:hypothetical protein